MVKMSQPAKKIWPMKRWSVRSPRMQFWGTLGLTSFSPAERFRA